MPGQFTWDQGGTVTSPGLAPPPGAANLSTFGAVSASTSSFPKLGEDNADAFDAAIASLPLDMGPVNTPGGTVFIPAGRYWVSRPIWIKKEGTRLTGAGRDSTLVCASNIGSGVPGLLQGFAGPVIIAGEISVPPAYGPDLFGGSGRSLSISRSDATTYILHDASVWSQLSGLTAMSVEGRWKVTNLGADNRQTMIQSEAYAPDSNIGNSDSYCFSIHVVNPGGGFQFEARLATSNGLFVATSALGSVVQGNTYDLSLNYDGAHLDFFVNGVSVGHIAATGTVLQKPWQNVTLGGFLAVPDGVGGAIGLLGCSVQSIRLSNIARHTGTGSYTPSSTPFVTDANTLALYNWDQGDASDPSAPWIIGQAHPPAGIGGGLMLHYVRAFVNFVERIALDHFSISGSDSCSGVTFGSSPKSTIKDFGCYHTTKYGIYHGGPTNFFSRHEDIIIDSAHTIGYWANPYYSINTTVTSGEVSVWFPAGASLTLNIQPSSITIYPMIFGGGGFGPSAAVVIKVATIDTEGTFPAMLAGMLFSSDLVSANTEACGLQVTTGVNSKIPSVLIAGLGLGGWLSNSDFFLGDAALPGLIEKVSGATISGPIRVDNPQNTAGATWTSTLVGSILKSATAVLA